MGDDIPKQYLQYMRLDRKHDVVYLCNKVEYYGGKSHKYVLYQANDTTKWHFCSVKRFDKIYGTRDQLFQHKLDGLLE